MRYVIPLLIVAAPTLFTLLMAGAVFLGLLLADLVVYGRLP